MEMSEERLKEIEIRILESGEDELGELRLWLFKETCKLENQKRSLDERKEALIKEREKFIEDKRRTMSRLERERDALWEKEDLADQKLEMLRAAYDKLEDDKQALERERDQLNKERSIGAGSYIAGGDNFFAGVNSPLSVKKRYRDLIKIYHPDNLCGDKRTLLIINQEYEYLCRMYQMDA